MPGNCDPPKDKQFTKDRQPDPKQRKKALRSRKENREMREYIEQYLNYPIKKIVKLFKDVKNGKLDLTVKQMAALNYTYRTMNKMKYTFDYRDRKEGKAAISIQHAGQIEIDHFFSILDEIEEEDEQRAQKKRSEK